MGRFARSQILYDGCYAHVFTRSLEKRWVFAEADDFDTFSAMLLKLKNESSFQIFHYCFMNTHFHLAVAMPSVERFSRAMQALKWEYTRHFNKKYKHHGPLWRERFKGLLIENEAYLSMCGQYIEQNPLKAKLVHKVEDWKYSSAGYYLGLRRDALVDGYDRPAPVGEVDLEDNAFFLRGMGIGSDWFKFQLRKGKLCMSPKR